MDSSLRSSSCPSCFTSSFLPLLISFSLPSSSPSIYHSESTFTQHWLNNNSLSVLPLQWPSQPSSSSFDTVTVFKVESQQQWNLYVVPHSVKTFILKCIDPLSPPLLLNLFSLAPPSTKGKKINKFKKKIMIWGHRCIVLCLGLVCVHVHVSFGLWSLQDDSII